MQVSPDEDRYLPAIDGYVKAGHWVEVDPEVGASLATQDGWTSARSAAAKKAAAKAADDKDS